MLATQSPISSHHRLIEAPISSRRPLQPKNTISTTTTNDNKPKPNPADWAEISNSNKENIPPPIHSTTPIRKESIPIDACLADELSAVREKLERQRIDREKNERVLRERGLMMDLQLKEMINRGELQKQLEIEVDRLYRLKEIRLACMRISGIRSLRDKEREKKVDDQIKNKARVKIQETDEQKDEIELQNK